MAGATRATAASQKSTEQEQPSTPKETRGEGDGNLSIEIRPRKNTRKVAPIEIPKQPTTRSQRPDENPDDQQIKVTNNKARRLFQEQEQNSAKQSTTIEQVLEQVLTITQQYTHTQKDLYELKEICTALQAENSGLKTQLQTMQAEHTNTQNLLQEIRKECSRPCSLVGERISNPQQNQQQSGGMRSYAAALQLNTSTPLGNTPPPSTVQRHRQEINEKLTVVINAVRTKKELKDAEGVKTTLQKALEEHEATKDI